MSSLRCRHPLWFCRRKSRGETWAGAEGPSDKVPRPDVRRGSRRAVVQVLAGRAPSAGLGGSLSRSLPVLEAACTPTPGPCPSSKPAGAGRVLLNIIPVILALLTHLSPSKGPDAHSSAPGPPRLASGFEGSLMPSLDPHIFTHSGDWHGDI